MSSKNNSPTSRKEVYLSKEVLALIDHMALKRDKKGLRLLNDTLAKLMLSGVIDKQTSFVDLGEYCLSLAETMEQEPSIITTSKSAKSLRGLIDSDLSQSK